jgi:hypothetical protein
LAASNFDRYRTCFIVVAMFAWAIHWLMSKIVTSGSWIADVPNVMAQVVHAQVAQAGGLGALR